MITFRWLLPLPSVLAGLALATGVAAADERVVMDEPTAAELIEALAPQKQPVYRGIRPRSERTEARSAPPAEPAAVELPMVTFAFDSAELTPRAARVLEELARALRSEQLQGSRILIEGHTDAIGDEAYNLELSRARADAVRRFLAARDVDPARLEVVGRGQAELLDPERPAAAVNRRVRIVNLDG